MAAESTETWQCEREGVVKTVFFRITVDDQTWDEPANGRTGLELQHSLRHGDEALYPNAMIVRVVERVVEVASRKGKR